VCAEIGGKKCGEKEKRKADGRGEDVLDWSKTHNPLESKSRGGWGAARGEGKKETIKKKQQKGEEERER